MMHWDIFRIKIEGIHHLMRGYMKIKETINNYLGIILNIPSIILKYNIYI